MIPSKTVRTCMVMAVCLSTTTGHAQSPGAIVPADTKFVLNVDIETLRGTRLGQNLIDIAQSKIMKEITDSKDEPTFEQLQEIIGFNPFQEVQQILVAAADYDRPDRSLLAAIRLRETTGNLEGLMLGLPGYESSKHNSITIHSAAERPDRRAHAAIHTSASNIKTLIVARDRAAVTHYLDHLNGKTSAEKGFRRLVLDSSSNSLLALEVLDLPNELLHGEGPQANIAKIVQTMSLRFTAGEDHLNVLLNLVTETPKQAEQLRQMAEGAIAMVEFAATNEPDDEDLQNAREFTRQSEVKVDGTSVSVTLQVPSDVLEQAVKEEILD